MISNITNRWKKRTAPHRQKFWFRFLRIVFHFVWMLGSMAVAIVIFFLPSFDDDGESIDGDYDDYEYGSAQNPELDRGADDIWDLHPKHYYDNDPPPPLS